METYHGSGLKLADTLKFSKKRRHIFKYDLQNFSAQLSYGRVSQIAIGAIWSIDNRRVHVEQGRDYTTRKSANSLKLITGKIIGKYCFPNQGRLLLKEGTRIAALPSRDVFPAFVYRIGGKKKESTISLP
jgi:hypothetical protein